jgi:hypothetical protein
MFLDENSGFVHSWLAILPSGFGFASVITAGLSESRLYSVLPRRYDANFCAAFAVAIIASVDRADMATATGLTYLFRYVGQVVGVASSASLLQAVLNTELHKRFTGPGSSKVSSPHTRTM